MAYVDKFEFRLKNKYILYFISNIYLYALNMLFVNGRILTDSASLQTYARHSLFLITYPNNIRIPKTLSRSTHINGIIRDLLIANETKLSGRSGYHSRFLWKPLERN